MSVCRACLCDGENLSDLDETFIHNYNALTGLKISHSDGLPQVKCETCMETVRTYAVFREKCLWAENMLQKKIILEGLNNCDSKEFKVDLKNNVLKIEVEEEIKIKEEPDCNDLSVTLGNDTYYFGAGDNLNLPDHCDDFEMEDEKPKKATRKSVRKKSKTKKFEPPPKEKKKNKPQQPIQLIKRELQCGLCPKVFQSRDKLNEHLEVHMKSKSCDICILTFLNCSVMFRHRQIHIPEDQHYCHLCLKNVVYIEYHYRITHFNEGGTGSYQCHICAEVLRNKKTLRTHRMKHTRVLQDFECDICKKKYSNKQSLKVHIIKHNTERHKCKLCESVYGNGTSLRKHLLRTHTPTMVKCAKCRIMYSNQYMYEKHKCHDPNERVVCSQCGIVLSKKQYSLHTRVQHSGLRFKCEICSHTLKTKGAYTIHMDQHKGTPRYTCEVCQKKFYSCSVLIKHKRIHTGEKPYVCSICSKGFTGNHNLKVHMKVHGFDLVVKKNSLPEETVFYKS